MQISQDLFNRSLNKLAQRQYKKDYIPAEEQVVLSIQSKIIGCLSSFVIYSGIPKSSKSTFMAITCASAFSNNDIFGIKLNLPNDRKRIAYFDTESSEFDFYKQINKIKYFSNLENLPETFSAFAFREDNPKEILTMVESFLITNTDTSVIILDGILDCLIDYNEVKESRELINWIKRITKKYNCLLLGVLHLGKKDMQTLGHFGSQSDRYAQSTLKIERNKEQNLFTLSSTFLRSSDDFAPINLTYNNGWYEVNASQNKPHTINDWGILEHKRCALNVLGGSEDSYENIVQYLKEMQGIGTNAAKGIVKKWIAEKIIVKRDKLYKLC
jgi:hypothetical protein